MKKFPKTSVIIPAHNEEEDIADTLDSVLKQKYYNKEIVVIDDDSTDNTSKIVEDYAKKHAEIKLYHSNGHSAASSRNMGAEKAKGDILVFLDADTRLNEDFLEKVSEDFKNTRVDAIGHPKKNTYKNFLSKSLALLAKPSKQTLNRKKGDIIESYIGFNIFVIKRKTFLKIGKYNEKIFYYEDEEMSKRFFDNGYKVFWDPTLLFYSEQPSDFKGFYRQYKWSARGIASMEDKQRRKKEIYYSLIKNLYIILPFLVLTINIKIGITLIILSYLFTFLFLFRANKKLFSLLMVPIAYLKNIFEFYNIIKFSSKKIK